MKLKRGFDIRLKGTAESLIEDAPDQNLIAVKPTDFPNLIPKLLVKAGDRVKVGNALFFDKHNPEILFGSPVSGTVKAVNRGERRRILEVIVESDGKFESNQYSKADPLVLSREQVIDTLLKSGMWPFIKQRPYGILAGPKDTPQNIFISGFNSAPLAPDFKILYKNEISSLQHGINAMTKLTGDKVFLGLSSNQSNSFLASLKNVEINTFEGPHPSGNVGIQIHHISPINKGDLVWTVTLQALVFMGRLFETGKPDFSKIIALTGSEVKQPKYFKTIHGTNLQKLLEGKTKKEVNERIISGNVLTGKRISHDDYLGFFDEQITVIPEGDEYEFMGWGLPGFNKFSASNTFFSSLFPKKRYKLNANLNGGERAFVMSGQYEKFLPMDILPVFLLKSILSNDIDKMEQLGIYEVIEEDLALCEYACTSKINVQDILRKGIISMKKELG